ncbi:sigma-54-dependent Fis family transcriptional regulator [Aliamphritea spongicola]|uniref:sigma-54-dependent Fis family transcriptional regulator n=1 Tax=Aliamphritea spongicola TaxID=707589 RepID=UPI00196AD0B8|nr:sigma 54-interacting transcriptional regulator [Aliamphritea spongicola]MBN3562991.1 sigma-54-dependent Fis family transcriptional regulator [Aliamphritea spongicola]
MKDNDQKPGNLGHDLLIKSSWQRCDSYGLEQDASPADFALAKGEVSHLKDKHHYLIDTTGHEVLPFYENILNNSSCLIILADREGQVLNCWGDNRFIDSKKRPYFRDGNSWLERHNGTNAIGTAIETGQAVQVQRDEHFLKSNRFMIGSAAPIYNTERELMGVLDVSSDAYLPQAHTLGMVKMMSQSVENRLIFSKFGDTEFLMTFNTHTDNLDSQWVGLIAFNEEGTIISANRRAEMLLRYELALMNVEEVFGIPLFELKNQPEGIPVAINALGKYKMYAHVRRPSQAPVIAPDFRERLQPQPEQASPWQSINYGDAKVERCIKMASTIMERDIPLLIQGETASGKESFCRALHRASQRRNQPFIIINCASLSGSTIEEELFGHIDEDTEQPVPGLIQQADNGTLLLKEIGDMPLDMQARFLRILEEGSINHSGSKTRHPIDFKLLASSHSNLKDMVESGLFRQDLYYRISGLKLDYPSLSQRTDKVQIVQQIHTDLREDHQPRFLSEEVIQLLDKHPWPGNFRQLSNVIQIALLMADATEIKPWHLPDDFFDDLKNSEPMSPSAATVSTAVPPGPATEPSTVTAAASAAGSAPVTTTPTVTAIDPLDETLKQYNLHQGNISRTAKALNISRNTLYKRLRELGIKQ